MPTEDRKLVLRVNELFHDLEGEEYDDIHPEIFEREKERWEQVFRQILPVQQKSGPMTCLDIGAGTGFIGSIILPMLSENDRLICADISQEMLNHCMKKLRHAHPTKRIEIQKLHDEVLPFETESIDAIMMNSVLHHIPDPKKIIEEMCRVLKKNGVLIIGHEPNADFFKHPFLRIQERLFHYSTAKRVAAFILKSIGLYRYLVPQKQSKDPVLEQINEILLSEGLVDTPLDRKRLCSIVDIHSPTAGGLHANRGFGANTVLKPWNDRLETLSLYTYNHLGKESGKHPWFRGYEKLLQSLLPNSGSTFFVTAQKRS